VRRRVKRGRRWRGFTKRRKSSDTLACILSANWISAAASIRSVDMILFGRGLGRVLRRISMGACLLMAGLCNRMGVQKSSLGWETISLCIDLSFDCRFAYGVGRNHKVHSEQVSQN
jgi:hypothetical protein